MSQLKHRSSDTLQKITVSIPKSYLENVPVSFTLKWSLGQEKESRWWENTGILWGSRKQTQPLGLNGKWKERKEYF